MFKRRTKEITDNSNLKVQLEMIKEQQRVLSTMKNSYNSVNPLNSIY